MHDTSHPESGTDLERELLLRLPFGRELDRFDAAVAAWMAQHGIKLMRIALGLVFIWFGALKLMPGLSPAEDLVRSTIYFIDPDYFVPFLALWEIAIGVGLVSGLFIRTTLFLLFAQMIGAALPLVMLPDVCYTAFPFGLTLEGQYIVKNLVLITAGIVVGSTVRGGRVVPEPQTPIVPTTSPT